MRFFERYDRFYRTSQTSPLPERLNGRHDAIVGRHPDRLAGKSVLDIASHDGRWSFAALQAGARHVVGIEARHELIVQAKDTFEHYGVAGESYEFIQGDVFEKINNQSFDVVLCLGFFYHTMRHTELLDKIDRTGARFVIIDTEIVASSGTAEKVELFDGRILSGDVHGVQFMADPVAHEQMAFADRLTRNGYTLVGRPSRAAIVFMAQHFGFACSSYDWPAHCAGLPDQAPLNDYADGWRDTFYLSKL